MVDPPVWWRISRAVIPPAYRPMIIASNPPRPPLAHGATGRGVERAGPVPGHHWSRRGPPRSRWSWSWCRPRALAAGRCRRLSLLHGPGCSAGSARRPRPRNLLGAERGAAPGPRSSRACPESICSNRPHPGPGLAQPPSHIAPVDGLVPLLSRPQSASVLPSGLTQTIEHAPRPWPPPPDGRSWPATPARAPQGPWRPSSPARADRTAAPVPSTPGAARTSRARARTRSGRRLGPASRTARPGLEHRRGPLLQRAPAQDVERLAGDALLGAERRHRPAGRVIGPSGDRQTDTGTSTAVLIGAHPSIPNHECHHQDPPNRHPCPDTEPSPMP